jgi:hypothetical protein
VLVSDQIFHAACGLADVSTERSLFANPFLPLRLRAAGRAAIQQKVYHAGDEEPDEVAEIGVTEPRGKRSVRFQAEHLELL